MGLLEQLWDDTVAGPRPETGLGKLRKSASVAVGGRSALSIDVPITSSITKTTTTSDSEYDSASSPPSASSVTPDSPLTPGTPRENWKRTIRRKWGLDGLEKAEPRSPTVYDWVVISALDR